MLNEEAKYLRLIIIAIALFLLILLGFNLVKEASATSYRWNDLIPICHWNEGIKSYVYIRPNVNGIINGHANDHKDIIPAFHYTGGNDYDGQNLDKLSWIDNDCQEPAPTPTTTPTPTVCRRCKPTCTPTVTPIPTEEVTPTPTQEPEVTPEVTPEITPEPIREPEKVEVQTVVQSPAGCDALKPDSIKDIWLEQDAPNNGTLILRWGQGQSDKVNIVYGFHPGDIRYSLIDTDNDGYEAINQLSNGTHYWFAIQTKNNCAFGEYSPWIDPTP